MRFRVACRGEISPGAIAQIEAEGIYVDVGGSVGGAVPGADIPDRSIRYYLRLDAHDASSAVRRAEATIKSAGGLCSHFQVEPEPPLH